MNSFPTSSTILAEVPLGKYLIKAYQLPQNTTCELIKSWVNDTYLIQTENIQFIFRVYRFNWRSKSEIEAELKFIELLKEKSIPVSYPIFDINNDWIQTFQAAEGERHGVLFSFAEGEKRMSLSPEVHFKIGVTIGKIHQQSEGLQTNRIHYSKEVLIENSFIKFSNFLSESDQEFKFTKKIKQDIHKSLDALDQNQLRKGMVHLDIWADNININQDDHFTIFDFDFCGNGWLILDYTYHLVMLFITTPDKDIYSKKAEAFHKGYSSIINLNESELKCHPQLGATLLFYYLGFQCEKFKTVFVNKTYVKGFINSRIKTWWNYHELS